MPDMARAMLAWLSEIWAVAVSFTMVPLAVGAKLVRAYTVPECSVASPSQMICIASLLLLTGQPIWAYFSEISL